MKSRAASVGEYLRGLDKKDAQAISQIRDMITRVAPSIEESMDHFMPFYKKHGKPIFAIARQKHYIAFYIRDLDAALAQNERLARLLEKFDKGKHCIRFRNHDEIPFDALRMIVKEKAG